ncbi:MAG: hypothetical protein FGM27_08220 [Candidatus Omnitrophica bacterium]|nr:hypothetical protein [Candidatus Omnitrophota bacterium]
MKKNHRWMILLLVLFVSLLTPVSEAASESVEKPYPKRIVSLSPSTTEILFALGAGDQIAGVTAYCEYPPEAKLKPKAGGFTEHSVEAAVALRPDLAVLTPNGGSQNIYRKFREIGLPAVSVPFYSLEDLSAAFGVLGKRTGHEDRAEILQRDLNSAVEEARTRPRTQKKNVLYVAWREPLIVAGQGTLEDDVVRLGGDRNAAARSRVRYPRWSAEALLEADPDVILDASAFERRGDAGEEKKAARDFWSRYPTLKAVREKRVVLLAREDLAVPGPRTVHQIRVVSDVLIDSNADGREYDERSLF